MAHLIISSELRNLYKLPLTGYISAGDILNKIPQEDVLKIEEKLALSRATFQSVEIEYRFMIEGREHYMISNINPNLDDAGIYLGSFGTVQDITTAKLSALALKKSEEEKAVVLNHTQTIICLHDMNGVLLDINPAAEKMSGFSKDEVIGLNLKLIVSPEYHGGI